MDHLTIFNRETRERCQTDFKGYTTSVGRVACHTRRTEFKPTDFNDFSLSFFDDLLEKGPANGCWDRNEFSSTADFLQCWLFFSLISVFLRMDISIKDFVEDNSKFVHTRLLHVLLQDWQPGRDDLWPINFALERANRFVSTWWNRLNTEWRISPELWLSISILGETLTYAQLQVFRREDVPWWEEARQWWWGGSQYLENAVKQKGWCRSTAKMLSTTYGNLSGLYIMALLQPPMVPDSARRALAYKTATSRRDHDSCGSFRCSAHLVDEQEFPLHLEKDCNCNSLQLDVQEIENILKRGNFPVAHLTQKMNQSGSYSEALDVHEVKVSRTSVDAAREHPPHSQEKFVALSHVWSDGLGNHKSNSLPCCRLKQIQRIVNELCVDEREGNADMLFWIDTLCIPWKRGELRNQAIKRMNSVYHFAHKVLVIDEDLCQFSSKNGLEPLFRINMSKWVRRLWTLTEGTLCDPKQLYFQFYEETALSVTRIEDIFDAAAQNRHLAWVECSRIFNPELRSMWTLLRENATTYSGLTELVDNLWQAVQWRISHRESDETLCLAALLDLPVEPLLALPENDEQRMCKFLTLLNESWMGIPAGMIFLPGPKLETDGFRWAVSTWMGSVPREYPYPLSLEHKLTHLTTRGLLLASKGLRPKFRSDHLPPLPFYARVWASNFTTDPRNSRIDHWVKIELIDGNYRFQQDQLLANGTSGMLSEDIVLILSNDIPKERPEVALLVYVTKENEGVKWVQTVSRVWATEITTSKERDKLAAKQSNNDHDVFSAEFITGSQFWCVEGSIKSTDLYARSKTQHSRRHLRYTTSEHTRPRPTSVAYWSLNTADTHIHAHLDRTAAISGDRGLMYGTMVINQPASVSMVGLPQDLARPPKRVRIRL